MHACLFMSSCTQNSPHLPSAEALLHWTLGERFRENFNASVHTKQHAALGQSPPFMSGLFSAHLQSIAKRGLSDQAMGGK
jgi:hypothetical protein